MDFFANMTPSLNDTNTFIAAASAVPVASYAMVSDQSPVALGFTTLLAAIVSFLGYQAWRPSVDPRSPAFTKDTLPIIGSVGFMLRQWSFWKGAMKESKTGNFSFWHGPHHVVGVTGAASRKMLMDHPNLDLVASQALLPFGIHFWPAIHPIFLQTGPRARNNTYFLRTLLDLMKPARLERVFPDLLKDARDYFDNLAVTNPSGVINSPVIWPAVFKQSTRLFFADDLTQDPELFKEASRNLDVILHTFSPFYSFCHWILEPSMFRRRLARYNIQRVVQKVYRNRISGKTPRRNDAMQMMIDNGDSASSILEFVTSGCFITTANAHIIFPRLIETMAAHPEWQEKVYQEIVAAADKHSKKKDGRLVDRLATMSVKEWETSFPTFELCMSEIIRAWTSFPVARLNVSDEAIPIPNSSEVIPGKAYAVYNSTELNFDPNLFPDPHKFDPMRFSEGRREFEKEQFGYFGWGLGQHPCAGKRYGRLQQYMLAITALAQYKWTRCDENGKPDLYAGLRQDLGADLNSSTKFALPPAYCKYEPRE